jgi:Na+-transporting NADH:ubiquinone oxidoreductase subunit NqrF
MRKYKGFALLQMIVFMSAVIVVSSFLASILVAGNDIAGSEQARMRAFYAAEAGIVWAKVKISTDPNWYTDVPHSPANDKDWLISAAMGSKGAFSSSGYKVIREEGSGMVYSIGFSGSSLDKARAISVIKIKFSSPPFTRSSWSLI